MPQKTSIVLTGFLSILIFICGCTGLTKEPVHKSYFDLAVTLPASGQHKICKDERILVKQLDINPTFDSHSFVYRLGENEYVMDYYSEFVNSPARLITEKIEESICDSSHFTSVQTGVKQYSGFRLSGKITRLYGDFQDPSRPRAVIEIQMTLEKGNGTDFTTISSKTYIAEEIISSRASAQLVPGWNKGLSKIIIEFINDFQTPSP